MAEIKESKKQRYKRAYEFPKIFNYPIHSPIHGRIILEVNSFSNPFPSESVEITSFVGQYINESYGTNELANVGLEPFKLQALAPERTFCEKLLAIRIASTKDPVVLRSKVRHLYDIYQLHQLTRIQDFIKKITVLKRCFKYAMKMTSSIKS